MKLLLINYQKNYIIDRGGFALWEHDRRSGKAGEVIVIGFSDRLDKFW